MRHYLPFIFLCLVPFVLTGQSGYDISKYKMQDITYHGLKFNLNGRGGYNHRGFNSTRITPGRFRGHYGNRYNDIELRLSYFRYKNTASQQSNTYISLTNEPSSTFGLNDPFISSGDWTSTSLYLKHENFNYKNGLLLYYGPILSSGISTQHIKNASKEDMTIKNRIIDVNIPIGIGLGRVEDVTDAWMAMRLASRLNQSGLLHKALSVKEMDGLSHQVSEIKRDRVYDFRLDRIFDITELDQYIRDNNWVNRYEAGYYTTLYDYYLYGTQSRRLSGTRTYMGVDWTLKRSFNENPRRFDYYNYYHSGIFIKHEQYRPVKLEHQLDFTFKSFIGKTDYPVIGKDKWYGYTSATLKWGYYPTTRTQFVTSIQGGIQYTKFTLASSPYAYQLLFKERILYYFSPRMALNFELLFGRKDSQYVPPSIQINPIFPTNLEPNKWGGEYKITFDYAFF